MWLVLASMHDAAARWAFAGLRARGLEPLEFVTLNDLAWSRRWEHRVGAAGASVNVELADRRTIAGARVRGVLNRLAVTPMAQLVLARAADRDYALHELSAFFLSWLHGLGGTVLNPPTPQGLAGQWRAPSEWLLLAGRAGLATAPFVRVSDPAEAHGSEAEPLVPQGVKRTAVVVLNGAVFGDQPPAPVAAGCAELAERCATPLLGVDFVVDGDWKFLGATPFPDLTVGGDALVDALAEALGR